MELFHCSAKRVLIKQSGRQVRGKVALALDGGKRKGRWWIY